MTLESRAWFPGDVLRKAHLEKVVPRQVVRTGQTDTGSKADKWESCSRVQEKLSEGHVQYMTLKCAHVELASKDSRRSAREGGQRACGYGC